MDSDMSLRTKRRIRRKRKGKRTDAQPDDYFAAGPFEFARFGRLMISRSRASSEEWKAVHAKMAADFPRIVSEIDALVSRIAELYRKVSSRTRPFAR
jgi:hypothetical protein